MTSSDGLANFQEALRSSELVLEMGNNRLFLGSCGGDVIVTVHLEDPLARVSIKMWMCVFNSLCQKFIDNGITHIYSLVSSSGRLKYAENLFGFYGTGVMLKINNTNMEVIRKDLL